MSSKDLQGREVRAKLRGDWAVRKYQIGSEPSDRLLETTTAEQRLEMLWELTRDSWALTGHPIPEYDRPNTPIRVVRRKQA